MDAGACLRCFWLPAMFSLVLQAASLPSNNKHTQEVDATMVPQIPFASPHVRDVGEHCPEGSSCPCSSSRNSLWAVAKCDAATKHVLHMQSHNRCCRPTIS